MKRPNRHLRAIRDRYVRNAVWAEFGEMTISEQIAIADSYEDARHNPNDPAVRKAYRSMIDSSLRQFCDAAGYYRIERWLRAGQPYETFGAMQHDVKRNKHLFFFRGGDLPPDHPLAQESALKIGDIELTHNEVFRAVHDLFGHAVEGHGFDAEGEESAFRSHSIAYPPTALPALTTETRGQSAWFFCGPHVRRPDNSVPEEGDTDFVPFSVRPFAVQKATLLHWAS